MRPIVAPPAAAPLGGHRCTTKQAQVEPRADGHVGAHGRLPERLVDRRLRRRVWSCAWYWDGKQREREAGGLGLAVSGGGLAPGSSKQRRVYHSPETGETCSMSSRVTGDEWRPLAMPLTADAATGDRDRAPSFLAWLLAPRPRNWLPL